MAIDTNNSRLEEAHHNIILSKVTSMELAILRLTEAVGKLDVIQERQIHTNAEVSRAFREIEKCHAGHESHEAAQASEYRLLQLRISALELQTPLSTQTNQWVMSAVWACAGAVAVFMAKQVGLL